MKDIFVRREDRHGSIVPSLDFNKRTVQDSQIGLHFQGRIYRGDMETQPPFLPI